MEMSPPKAEHLDTLSNEEIGCRPLILTFYMHLGFKMRPKHLNI